MKIKYLILTTVVSFLLASACMLLYMFEAFIPGNYEIPGSGELYFVLTIFFGAIFIVGLLLTAIQFLSKKTLHYSIYFCGIVLISTVLIHFMAEWETEHLYTDIFSWLRRMAFLLLVTSLFATYYKSLKKAV